MRPSDLLHAPPRDLDVPWSRVPNPQGLTTLEVHAGRAVGTEAAGGDDGGRDGRGGGARTEATGPPADPRAALRAQFLPALRRAPCGVTFSGGRDSSAVLAVAVAVARREGLPDPVPVTMRWRGAPEADESDWQRLVVDHLGLDDWIVLDLGDELDYLGPLATRALRDGGLYHPPHYHAFGHMAAQVAGGSLLTGIGGDALLRLWRWREAAHPSPDTSWTRRLLQRLHAAAPVGAARLVAASRFDPPAWLRPAVRRELTRRVASARANEPRRYADRLAWLRLRRVVRLAQDTLERFGAPHGTHVHTPLLAAPLLDALARIDPERGPGRRIDVMHLLFGDVLPRALIERDDKAVLVGGYHRAHSRRFADTWDGTGLHPDVVDADVLRSRWRAGDAEAALTMQAAWLAERRSAAPDDAPDEGA